MSASGPSQAARGARILCMGEAVVDEAAALSGFYPSVVAAALGESVGAAARACERWGALD